VRHGHNGLLAERGDAGSLAGALADLLGNPHLAAALASGQQEVRATFLSPAAIRDAHLDLYRSLLGIQPGSGKSARRKEAS
jgi:glycosyltransferase involved in cell wall biosynthesis